MLMIKQHYYKNIPWDEWLFYWKCQWTESNFWYFCFFKRNQYKKCPRYFNGVPCEVSYSVQQLDFFLPVLLRRIPKSRETWEIEDKDYLLRLMLSMVKDVCQGVTSLMRLQSWLLRVYQKHFSKKQGHMGDGG